MPLDFLQSYLTGTGQTQDCPCGSEKIQANKDGKQATEMY